MAARYSVYMALFVLVLVIIYSKSSHGFPTNNEVEEDMDDAGMLNGRGESKELLTGTSINSKIVIKPEDKTSNQNKFKPEFVINPHSNLRNINWFTDYIKDSNNTQQILDDYPRLEHFIFTDLTKNWNVNALIETLELYQYKVQPCSSHFTSVNQTNENEEKDNDLAFTSNNDLGDGNSRNFTVDHELYTEAMPEQPLKGISEKTINKMLALSNASQSVDTNKPFDSEPNNDTKLEHFEFLNITQITILNETNYDLDLKFVDHNHNETLESIQLENRKQTETNEQFESGTETGTDSIILPTMATNAASQIQTICNNQNENLNNLYENDAKLKSALLTLNEQRINLNQNINQHINYTNIFSEYDRAFKKLTLSNQDTLANQIQVLMTKLQEMITHMQQRELNDQQYRVYIQDRVAAVEGQLLHGESAAAEPKLVDTPQSEEFRVTNMTCNAQRRHLLGNSCYYIPRISAENLLFSWWDARFHCKQVLGNRGDLVILETKQEMFDLTILLRSHFGDIDEFWLGASNLNSKNNRRWSWVDGNQLDMNTLNDWDSTLMLHSDNSCMAMYGSFQFHGEPCFYERYPVCEIKFQNKTCNAQRRHLLGNSCYYIPRVSAENLLFSWWDARYHCKQVLGNRGDLVILETKQEMFDLTILLRSHFGDIDEFWLVASNLDSKNNRRWNWVDGSQLDMNTLNDWGSTLMLHSDNSCMAMYGSFQFHGEPCFYERYPVCEIKFEQS